MSGQPVPLQGDALSRRIYAPEAYRFVRDLQIVPIVHSEALKLATWFPIAWRSQTDAPELVVLRALIADRRAQPPHARALFPLLLAAFPFVFDPETEPMPGGQKMLADSFADEPTDIGATVTTLEGKPGVATRMRFDALDSFAEHLPTTRAIGSALATGDLLEPWRLKFDVGDESIEIEGLLIARQTAFESGRYASILGLHGVAAAQLLGLHRLSLFRAGLLLTMAKTLIADPRRNQAPAIVPEHTT